MKNHRMIRAGVCCLLFLTCSQLMALSETSRSRSRALMTKAALSEAVDKQEESLKLTLSALEIVRHDMGEESLVIYHKAIDALWKAGRDKEAISLCDEIISSIVMPKIDQKKSLGLAVWKKSLIESGIQEGFSIKDKEKIAKVSNIAVDKYVIPAEEKKSPNEMSGFFVMLTSSNQDSNHEHHSQEDIQRENDLSWEKEVQSWIDAKDAVKEALDGNNGSAIEKAAESVIHHMESLYHGGKAIGMELHNRFGGDGSNHDEESSSTPEPGSYEDRSNR